MLSSYYRLLNGTSQEALARSQHQAPWASNSSDPVVPIMKLLAIDFTGE
jgi:hypothetical protein